MIRGLLVTTVVSFLVAVACLAGAVAVGGSDWGGPSWSFNNKKECVWSPDGSRTCTSSAFKARLGPADRPGVRTYAWSGGDSLAVSAPAEIRYTQGHASKVTISGPESVLQRVTFDNGEIDLTGRRSTHGQLVITVEAPNVTSFHFNGGQKIDIADYAQDTLKIEANGAVDLHAKGTARRVDLRMNGASNADLDEVINEEAKIELNGASNASIAPKSSVDIRINGVGNVSLGSKPPHMTKEIHGIGSVSTVTGKATEAATGAPPSPPKPPAPPRQPASTT